MRGKPAFDGSGSQHTRRFAYSTNPLTHRLAVPPLPCGEGKIHFARPLALRQLRRNVAPQSLPVICRQTSRRASDRVVALDP